MKALKFFLRMWGFIVGMVLTFAALPVGECKFDVDDIRSAFIEEVEEIDKTTYVIGHTCPDSDTVCSAIAYANLKQKLNVKCEPRISGKINKETDFILKYFDVDAPPLIDNISGQNIILVDHNVSAQAVSGIEAACVVEIIDHHNLFGDIKSKTPIFYLTMPVGSTSTIIWLCYRQNNVAIDKKMAGIMFGAILSDTDNLRSANTTNLDKEAAENLQKIAAIADRNKFFVEMERDFTSYDGMSEREIIFTDFKEFCAGGRRCGWSTVATLNLAERDNLKVRLDDFMQKFFATQEFDMFFIKVHEIESYTAEILAYGADAREILSAALGLTDENFILETNIPNKKIARAITATLENLKLVA
ncbi:MAG: DHH family phosphoesterase [Selenomonadaceae bacterium]|nr:DHH family phosphoesterase [Selenomonadaceae bacterium]